MDARPSFRTELEADDLTLGTQPVFASARTDLRRHPMLTIALHWGTVIVIIAGVSAMFIRDTAEERLIRQVLLDVHRQLGLIVLMGAGLRMLVRLRTRLGDYSSGSPPILQWAAKACHFVLYALLIALPLEGWILSNAHGISIALFGIVPLPNLIAPDSELADALSDYHIWLAWALLALVSMHATAAFWHHLVRRDGVLRAMCPRWLIR